MDVKTAFLNDDLFEDVYMVQLVGFQQRGMVIWFVSLRSRFMVLIRHASRKWYLKFDKVITINGFKENVVDRCIYI